ncbi:helix-turn-helix domain-containing protein [Streptomyces sp. NPDC049906]|uniref:helix-turn-helix domain-containing protein n=1 Tax=Streptomyces sp. NPDC049906 TaxID=3155656 RepID=UPI00343B7557
MPALRTTLNDNTTTVDHALGVLSPRWTTWTLQTLRQRETMRAGEISAAMPWNTRVYTIQLLRRLEAQGLVHRPGYGVYGLTAAGKATEPVHRALADWHRAHFTTATADAERAEGTLLRLRHAGTTAVLAALDRHGPLTQNQVVEATGLSVGSSYVRMRRMEQDGLVVRSGQGRENRYELSPAAENLGDVYATLSSWAQVTVSPPAAAARPVHVRPQAASAEWAAVAVQRAPATVAVPGLFSHPPAAQPLVPAAVTTASRPHLTR